MTRIHMIFNREWKFFPDESENAYRADFDDSAWERIGLPHSFGIPYFLGDGFRMGAGWYRKTFDCPPDWIGKVIRLEFEGSFRDTQVYLNGEPAGSNDCGYTGFEIDLTRFVKPGKNVLAIRVDNIWNARKSPRAGEHTFHGGIYRNVYLNVLNPIHVAWYGTRITTADGLVTAETEIEAPKDSSISLTTEIYDPNGRLAGCCTSDASAGFHTQKIMVDAPMLWSPETPNLYNAVTVIKDRQGGVELDRYETTFGFRTLEWTADRGFFLNGQHRYFRGANLHQDRAGWCDAGTEAGMERDLKLMKDCGFDSVRGSHYPHSPAFADACDRLGLLFWSENNFWCSGGHGSNHYATAFGYPEEEKDRPDFEAHVKKCLEAMIRINRNHPSIFVWSMCNEPFFNRVDTLPQVRNFLRELVELTHKLDPSRKAAIGGCQRADMDHLGDVAGYNGDGVRLYPKPDIPNVVSEYGSLIATRPGEFVSGRDEVEKQDNPGRSGEMLWCGIDHGSRSGKFGWMGAVDYFRIPKRQWYWYRENYAGIPHPEWSKEGIADALELTSDRTEIGIDGRDDAMLTVRIKDKDGNPLSNSPAVTLTVEEGPGELPTGRSITFEEDSDIAIRDGICAIEMRAYYAGRIVVRATSPGLKDAVVTIAAKGDVPYVKGVSAVACDRPYHRWPSLPREPSSIALNQSVYKPTWVSSEMPGFPGSNAVEGLEYAPWRPAEQDKTPWFKLDLERLLEPEAVGSSCGEAKYEIEVSEDNQTWVPFQPGIKCRFVRLTFPAGVKEVFSVWVLAK